MDRIRNILAGRWGRVCLVTFLLVASSLLITLIEYAASLVLGVPLLVDIANTPNVAVDDIPNVSITAILCVMSAAFARFLFVSPIEYGAAGWYRSLVSTRGEDSFDVLLFFSAKRRMASALGLKAAVFIRRAFWGAVFFALPTALMAAVFILNPESGEGLFFKGAVFSLAAVSLLLFLMWLWFCQRYALAEYVLAAAPEVSVAYAIRRSKAAMRGYCGKLLALKLRLLWCYIAELLILPAFYAMPMRMTAVAVFADDRLTR